MGADIHIFAEIKKADKWEKLIEEIFPDYFGFTHLASAPFDRRSYNVFGFLADVRNYSNSPNLGENKGLPDDSEYLNESLERPREYNYGYVNNGMAYTRKEAIEKDIDYHSCGYYTLRELVEFDYENTFEDLRYTETKKLPNGGSISNGAAIVEPGKGTITTFREFLGEGYFKDIEILKRLGDLDSVRIVFWFDN